MDGYSLTEKMRKARRRFRFTATEQALFHELVAICNGEDWRDVFDCSNMELCFALSINEKTLTKARESLINAGLIYYKSGKSKRTISSYSFTRPFKTAVETTVKNSPVTPTDKTTNKTTNSTTNGTDYYKTETETKTKYIPYSPLKGYEDFSFDFVQAEYRQTFFDWLVYKKERREKYKTQRSLELCYKKLLQLANNNSETARLVVEQSMADNWAGLFELKNKNNGAKKQTDIVDSSNVIIRSTDG